MIETTHSFEEIPVMIGTVEIAECTGTAHLEGEVFPHDYGYRCVAIELDGNKVGDYCDKRQLLIHANSDDEFARELFKRLAVQIEASDSASSDFYSAAEMEAA